MATERAFWINKIEALWKQKNVLWLKGVRRAGKTTLSKSLKNIEIFDCELPRIRELFKDPEFFFQNLKSKNIVLDEIHRLPNPSEVLKIAADYFPKLKVIATGSSTLSAHKKFKDSLTDRKRELWLTPMNHHDFLDLKCTSLEDRLLKGGLPPFSLKKEFDETGFSDWIDSFWAKDIQEQFSIRKRSSFLKFFELLSMQSGGLFEAQSFTSACGVTHNTIFSYLDILEITCIALKLRPFFKNKNKEIISAPKVYFFDTGFINYFLGINKLDDNRKGYLWEHYVLNEFLSFQKIENIHYWRDKANHEIDFILKERGKNPVAIECKWKSHSFDPKNLLVFRKNYPEGENYIICTDIQKPIRKTFGNAQATFLNVQHIQEYFK